ncbi:XRE family transcriptional regulator [Vibrio aestuarianus]|uniref:XRE family transcriptional regulator n=1 Tax=Vibrio aestuarianus TaxID=28171 RepID=UPI00237CD7BE|nr:XRE family transcriptional regulator [Vibrio aestuarianus]MDE1271040.1 helix-turn-helix domain-containing protein [Vibrio aestuarianus]WDS59823.1 helix-turn-helix domain-containing protein [Vibrio aestuarianus]
MENVKEAKDIRQDNQDIKYIIMDKIIHIKKINRYNQDLIGQMLNASQPRVSDLLAKKTDKFSIDILLDYLRVFGWSLNLSMSKTGKLQVKLEKINPNFTGITYSHK